MGGITGTNSLHMQALGGKAKTVVIVAAALEPQHAVETIQTLRFGGACVLDLVRLIALTILTYLGLHSGQSRCWWWVCVHTCCMLRLQTNDCKHTPIYCARIIIEQCAAVSSGALQAQAQSAVLSKALAAIDAQLADCEATIKRGAPTLAHLISSI